MCLCMNRKKYNDSRELQQSYLHNLNNNLTYFIELWQLTKGDHQTSWTKKVNTRSYYVCCASSFEQNPRNTEVRKTKDYNSCQDLQLHRYFDTESMILFSFLTFWYLESTLLKLGTHWTVLSLTPPR